MATFNSLGLSSSATPSDGMGLNVANQSVTMDGIDTTLFDDSLLDGVNGAFPPLPFTPSYDFQDFSGFEDPFSYSSKPFEAPAPAEGFNEDSPPQELDNKLLGFSAPTLKAAILDESGQSSEPSMSAELYGMFFVAEDVFGGDSAGRPLELTCYRRNLWQCSGQIILPRHVTHVVNEQGLHIPIFELAVSITAVESIEGKATEIISIPWKSATAVGVEEPKVAGGPPNIVLDLSSGQEVDASRVSLPIAWKRLQFKHATANNGRRKGLQQHYLVHINLLGKQKSGEYLKIAEIQSGPVIVRGRSPRNFDSKKDIPLNSDKKIERRGTSSDGSFPKEANVLSSAVSRYPSLGNMQQAGDWATSQVYSQQGPSQPPAKKIALSPSVSRPPIPAWSMEPGRHPGKPAVIAASNPHRPGNSGPINLSLSEDERSPNRSNSDLQSPQFPKTAVPLAQNPSQSPVETADLLYEYFPLSVDDWMPPVEAIYRPHVVHHTITPPEIKTQHGRNKPKRYFTAES